LQLWDIAGLSDMNIQSIISKAKKNSKRSRGYS